ncbi:MAG: four helix bundle protein [bacterium]
MTKYDIRERSLEFAVGCANLVNKLIKSQISMEYGKQLVRSSASVGANIEEADGALSRRDFVNKMAIVRREARESRYWLRLIDMVSILAGQTSKNELDRLKKEAEEIMLILSSIVNKARDNRR